MTVLAILATAAMPLVELTVKRNKERELKEALSDIRHALDAYKAAYDAGKIARAADGSGYPPSLVVLLTGVPNSADEGKTLYFLRRIPRDPFASPDVPAAASWGLRSYASAPDHPLPGADVYDVYSLSNQSGMNGVAYRQW